MSCNPQRWQKETEQPNDVSNQNLEPKDLTKPKTTSECSDTFKAESPKCADACGRLLCPKFAWQSSKWTFKSITKSTCKLIATCVFELPYCFHINSYSTNSLNNNEELVHTHTHSNQKLVWHACKKLNTQCPPPAPCKLWTSYSLLKQTCQVERLTPDWMAFAKESHRPCSALPPDITQEKTEVPSIWQSLPWKPSYISLVFCIELKGLLFQGSTW